MLETINQRVARFRKLSNLTQQETAEKLGMKCSTYSQMERKGIISAQKILDLAEIFKVAPNILLFGEEFAPIEPEPPKKAEEPKAPLITPFPQDQLILTQREENLIKMIRGFSKEKKQDAFDYVEAIYKKNFEKK